MTYNEKIWRNNTEQNCPFKECTVHEKRIQHVIKQHKHTHILCVHAPSARESPGGSESCSDPPPCRGGGGGVEGSKQLSKQQDAFFAHISLRRH